MVDELDILAADLKPPRKRFSRDSRPKPGPKAPLGAEIAGNVVGARTDAELEAFLAKHRDDTVIVNFGSTWCHSCHTIFPHLYKLTSQFAGFKYVIAQIDYMDQAAKDVHFTPSFRVVRKGKVVDQFHTVNQALLRDRLWLHSD